MQGFIVRYTRVFNNGQQDEGWLPALTAKTACALILRLQSEPVVMGNGLEWTAMNIRLEEAE